MQIQVFNNPDFGDVRVVMKDGVPWFVAADVCRVLELTNPTVALERLDDDTNIINKSGLYALTLTSRKPNAKKFRKWLTNEVVPSIFRMGSYSRIRARYSAENEVKLSRLFFHRQKELGEGGKIFSVGGVQLSENIQKVSFSRIRGVRYSDNVIRRDFEVFGESGDNVKRRCYVTRLITPNSALSNANRVGYHLLRHTFIFPQKF